MHRARVRTLRSVLVALAMVAAASRVEAGPYYDDGAGNGCVSCHNGFTVLGGSVLHTKHLDTFGITSCTLCHQTTGGETPVLTYWSNDGFGCSGCHGMDYGETTSSSLALPHLGQPKSTSYGLRAAHAIAFAANSEPDHCATCHFPGSAITGEPDPAPAILPETTPPPYYGRVTNNLTDPCSSAQENFDGVFPGLDNDGNGFADMTDPACLAVTTTTTTTVTTSTTTTTIGGTAKRITVYPGQSIQDAVDAIAPGGTVYVMPGVYQEDHVGPNAVTVTKNDVKLVARSNFKKGRKVILQPKPGRNQRNGIVIEGTPTTRVDGSKVKGFTVEGFPNNGIWTRYVDNFRIERNESIDNLENGIWPTLSANGLVKKNVAYGSDDAALWVEASENIRVFANEVYDSPTGLEITVSYNVVARKNIVHDNTTGIGLYNNRGAGLPPLSPPEKNGFWEIVDNHVYNNNKVNDVAGGLVELLPPGGGILVIGVDNVNVENNRIENNDFYGIAVVDWCLAVSCPEPPPIPPALDGASDNNTFVRNTLVNNGTNPQPGDDPLLQLFAQWAADITYVEPGPYVNCFAQNVFTPPIKGIGVPTEANHCS
jgi:parallel beta-helix repeat protein